MKILTTAEQVLLGEYEDLSRARRVMDELQRQGVDPKEISLISAGNIFPQEPFDMSEGNYVNVPSTTEQGAESGAVVGGVGGSAAGLMSLAIPGAGPVLVAGSILMGAILGMSFGVLAGGAIGFLMEIGYTREQAESLDRGLAAGHALLLVEDSSLSADAVRTILEEHEPVAVITQHSH